MKAQFMKKLNNSEDELKKGMLIKKACILGKKMKKKILQTWIFCTRYTGIY